MFRRTPVLLEVPPQVQLRSFSSDLFKSLTEWPEKEDAVICPVCWTMLLAALSLGGRGYTRFCIVVAVGVVTKDDHLNAEYYLAYKEEMKAKSMKMVAKIMISNKYKLKNEGFGELLDAVFGVEVEEVDSFTSIDATTFLKEKLGSYDSKPLAELEPRDDFRMVLVLGSNFEGLWENQFKIEDSFIGDFYTNSGKKKAIYMVQEGKFYYLRKPKHHIEVLELPYLNKEFSLVIYLPSPTLTLTDLENYLSKVHWMLVDDVDLSEQRVRRKMKVAIPRFLAVDRTKDYTRTLRELHLKLTPEYMPDFSGFSGTPELALSAIYHRFILSVDETGSGKQSVADDIGKINRRRAPCCVNFNANRPFFFTLVQRPKKKVIYVGHVADPMAS